MSATGTLLSVCLLATAGLYAATKGLPRVAPALAPTKQPAGLEMGLRAITGALVLEHMQSLEPPAPRMVSAPVPAPAPVPALPPPPAPSPAPTITEAWADDRGCIFARHADGSLHRLR